MTTPAEPSPSPANEEALLLKVVLDHADNVEALLAAEIDRRELLEQELIAAKEAAEAANRAKTLFLAKVNHDLRNPLTAMLGVVHLLERLAGLPPSAPQWLDMLNRAGDQMNQLIDDLLDISRIEAGKMELELQPLALNAVIGEVTESNRPLAVDRRLEFRVSIADAPPPLVIGDRNRLRRILNNLLGNAIKFTPSGWVELGVEALSEPAAGPGRIRIRFSVSDSGCGIPYDRIAHLFAPFEQGEGKERHQGLGLGLSISAELVELMGGHLSVESQVGAGSRFWFDLEFPLADEEGRAALATPSPADPPPPAITPSAAPGPTPAPRQSSAPTAPSLAPPCVLLVDDDPSALELLSLRLQEAGLRTLSAPDGLSALGLARAQHPDLILLDVRMPGWDGFETCRRLKRNPLTKRIPVIFLSGAADLESRLEGFRAGGVDYIGKPFAEPEVLARVTVHLACRRLGELNLGHPPPADADSPTLLLALRARDLLMGRIDDPPSLSELARATGTNQTTLNQAFQRHFGMSVFEYLREQRLVLAKRMLREGRTAIKVIALEVGYQNSRDFSRAFKTRLGVTPEEYREGPAE